MKSPNHPMLLFVLHDSNQIYVNVHPKVREHSTKEKLTEALRASDSPYRQSIMASCGAAYTDNGVDPEYCIVLETVRYKVEGLVKRIYKLGPRKTVSTFPEAVTLRLPKGTGRRVAQAAIKMNQLLTDPNFRTND